MKPKFKLCSDCGKERLIWKNDKGNRYCKPCWLRKSTLSLGVDKSGPSRIYSAPIARRSKKRAAQEREYTTVRREFIILHPLCKAKIPGLCTKGTTDVHHMKGKIELLLLDTRYFLPVCRKCHDWIEDNPTKAKELGYSLNRLSNE